MGRGRAKAKQTKVARDLKYRSYSTDFASLERELRGSEGEEPDYPVPTDEVEVDVDDDQYSDLASRYADFDDDEARRIS